MPLEQSVVGPPRPLPNAPQLAFGEWRNFGQDSDPLVTDGRGESEAGQPIERPPNGAGVASDPAAQSQAR